MPQKPRLRAVGRNVARKGGIEKVTGRARYIDDLTFPGLLHGRTIRSTIPFGEIVNVRPTFPSAGFTIVDWRDIPGRNVVALIEDDQPCLVETEVRHAAEPILLLAHEDREKLLAARVEVEYERCEPVFNPLRSPRALKRFVIEKGDLEKGFAKAHLIVEGTYRTGHQEHVYIEPNGVVAVPEEGRVSVYGSMQCPFYVIKALKSLLGANTH